jgi:hypothetical protein
MTISLPIADRDGGREAGGGVMSNSVDAYDPSVAV